MINNSCNIKFDDILKLNEDNLSFKLKDKIVHKIPIKHVYFNYKNKKIQENNPPFGYGIKLLESNKKEIISFDDIKTHAISIYNMVMQAYLSGNTLNSNVTNIVSLLSSSEILKLSNKSPNQIEKYALENMNKIPIQFLDFDNIDNYFLTNNPLLDCIIFKDFTRLYDSTRFRSSSNLFLLLDNKSFIKFFNKLTYIEKNNLFNLIKKILLQYNDFNEYSFTMPLDSVIELLMKLFSSRIIKIDSTRFIIDQSIYILKFNYIKNATWLPTLLINIDDITLNNVSKCLKELIKSNNNMQTYFITKIGNSSLNKFKKLLISCSKQEVNNQTYTKKEVDPIIKQFSLLCTL